MNPAHGMRESHAAGDAPGDLRFLRIMLGLQVILGLLWGISMLFFARQIVLEAVWRVPILRLRALRGRLAAA